jgi:hypothetical protein
MYLVLFFSFLSSLFSCRSMFFFLQKREKKKKKKNSNSMRSWCEVRFGQGQIVPLPNPNSHQVGSPYMKLIVGFKLETLKGL